MTNSEKVIEYGETYEPNIADFVDENKIDNTYSISGEIGNEDGKDYPAIGDYNFTISAKGKENADVRVLVRDTIAPVFDENSPSEISTFKDVTITEDDLKNTFVVTDLLPVALSINDVDYSTVGEYTTNVYATDESGNVTNKEVKVIVQEPTISIDPVNISLTVGETATISATVHGASQDIAWTSSDEGISKVENGVVTAVKEGTATVEAEANGIKTSVTVAVTSVRNNTTTGSNKSSTNSSSSNNKNQSSNKNNSSSSNTSSGNSNSSSNNKPSSSTGSTTSHQHSMSVGNIGKWFNSRNEVQAYVSSVMESWNSKYEDGKITWEEYAKNCPSGYECWSCSWCGKWTGNFKYFK
ncbi:MAG: hypothetical protein LIO43_03010 [Clostridiales bacterium]|nr:hypothetical protein [Clostridiales bacterium]